jgi:hypothetical protein
MAASSEDYLIDDGISVERFGGTLAFVADIGSNQSLCHGDSSCDFGQNLMVSDLPDSRMGRPGPVSIRFEVIDARIEQEDHGHKYVIYTILVMRSDGVDSAPAKVDRRYSDFNRLHTSLRKHFPALTHDISFPGKQLTGNYKAETIAHRSRAFEQYLSHVFAVSALRTSAELSEFFYGDSLRNGYIRIGAGDYVGSLAFLRSAWRLQAKLLGDSDTQAVATLCAIIAVHNALDDNVAACMHAERALECFGDSGKGNAVDQHLVPVLRLAIRLCWKLGRDKRRLEEWFEDLRRRGVDVSGSQSLLDLVVGRFSHQHITSSPALNT